MFWVTCLLCAIGRTCMAKGRRLGRDWGTSICLGHPSLEAHNMIPSLLRDWPHYGRDWSAIGWLLEGFRKTQYRITPKIPAGDNNFNHILAGQVPSLLLFPHESEKWLRSRAHDTANVFVSIMVRAHCY